MHSLRRARQIALGVLAWFVLSLGAAVLSPAIAAAGLPQDICSAADGTHVLQDGEAGGVSSHVAHCPACVHSAAPPPADVVAAVLLHAPAAEPLPPAPILLPQPPRAAWTARGPPALS